MLVDLRPAVVAALRELVEGHRPALEWVGQASSYSAALDLAVQTEPDVVLLRIFPDRLVPADVVAHLTQRCLARVLILKNRYDPAPSGEAHRHGAHGFVLADGRPQAIVDAILAAHGEGRGPGQAPRLIGYARQRARPITNPEHAKLALLTLREKEVIWAIAAEPSAKYLSIAGRLGISEHTVHNHLSKIYQKLELTNRIDLVMYSLRNGLSEHDEPSPALIKLHRTGRAGARQAGAGKTGY